MNHHALRRLLALTTVAVACLAMVPAATPAQEVRPKAPVPSKTGKPPRVRNMMLLVIIGAVGIGVHAIPSKRGHQD